MFFFRFLFSSSFSSSRSSSSSFFSSFSSSSSSSFFFFSFFFSFSLENSQTLLSRSRISISISFKALDRDYNWIRSTEFLSSLQSERTIVRKFRRKRGGGGGLCVEGE